MAISSNRLKRFEHLEEIKNVKEPLLNNAYSSRRIDRSLANIAKIENRDASAAVVMVGED